MMGILSALINTILRSNMQHTMLLEVSHKNSKFKHYIYTKKINSVAVESKGGIPAMFEVSISYANDGSYTSDLLTDAEVQDMLRAIDERLEYVGNFMSI